MFEHHHPAAVFTVTPKHCAAVRLEALVLAALPL